MDKRRHNQHNPWDDSAYGTGSTEPPRNNGLLVTVLLILVICLIGAVSALSFQNIQLFHRLNRQNDSDTPPLSILDETQEDDMGMTPQMSLSAAPGDQTDLGIDGEEISPFYQRYYRLPRGLYITQVTENSVAATLGLQPGDILLSIDGSAIATPADLQSLLDSFSPGKTVQILIYRAGQQLSFRITLRESGWADR